ncbi:MAG TPA: hypothetical protein VFS49_00160, partial [Croceibacterium sp.]|nr:hypothetical protein [Croceibacterium sp.]
MVGQEQTHTGNTGTGDDNYRFWHALKPCRVPFLVLVAGVIFLLTGQGVDVMRALAEQRPGEDGPGSQIYSFSAAVLAWSISLWYWSRSMFRLKLPGVPGNVPAYRWLRTVTPRALGCIALLSVSLAFYRASNGYAPGEQQETRELLRFYSYAWAAAAAGFLAVVIMRRRWLAPLFGAEVSKAEEEAYGTSSFMQLGMPAIVTLGAAVALAATLFVGFAAFPHAWAPWFGAAAIVVFAAFGWTTVGSMVDFIGMGRRIPIFSALLLFAVLFSISNDNHEVRTLAIGQSAPRENLRQSLDSWLVRQEKTKRPGERIPLFLVNAEGGGIRAAYWTASVLGEIQANNPAFADHLYSISGVSGGSLGAAVYVALLAQSREQDGLDIKQTA